MTRHFSKFDIRPGSSWSGKVQRYLRAAGLDHPNYVTDKMRQRHIHLRHKRHIALQPVIAPVVPANPFAQFGKKA